MIVAQAPGIIPSGEQGIDVFANPSSAQSLQLFQFLSDTQIMDDLLKPKSYLVYLFFDKRMVIDGHYSGIINVKDANQLNILQHHLSAMQREGYFYTPVPMGYVTNQSERRVYYNNLTLVHKRGNIVQSNDYYPLVPMGFGLTWENPKDDLHTYHASLREGKELQRNEWSSGGLDMLDFSQRDHYVAARMYNPLIGRWHNPDPLNQFDSPYNAMGNNPVINIDPNGMWSLPLGGILTGLSFTQIRYIANPRTMNNDPYMTTSGGMLQVAGAAISFWEGGKILRDKLFDSGSSAINQMTPNQCDYSNSNTNSGFPTVLEAAYLASHVYSFSGILTGGWQLSALKVEGVNWNTTNDLQSALYERIGPNGGVSGYAYVTRGSESKIDFIENKKQLYGNSSQYKDSVSNARILSTMLGDIPLTFVGHSLGGGLAAANSMATGDPAITFNAAWVSPSTILANELMPSSNIFSVVVQGEIVDYLQQNTLGVVAQGTRFVFPFDYSGYDPGSKMGIRIANHMIGTIIQMLMP